LSGSYNKAEQQCKDITHKNAQNSEQSASAHEPKST